MGVSSVYNLPNIPPLRLFSTTPGQAPQVAWQGSANKAYTLPATAFSPSLAVNPLFNSTPSVNRFAGTDTGVLALNSQGQLGVTALANQSSSASAFSLSLGGANKVTASTGQAPVLSAGLQDRLGAFFNVDTVGQTLSQSSFELKRAGLQVTQWGQGLTVGQDANGFPVISESASGGIDSVRVKPGLLQAQANYLRGAEFDPLINGTAIGQAAFKGYLTGSVSSVGPTAQPFNPLNAPLQQAPISGLGAVNPLAQLVAPKAIAPINPFDSTTNPLLDRLRTLQPPEQGLVVSGIDSQLSPEQLPAFIAAQQGFNVQVDSAAQLQLAQLRAQAAVGQVQQANRAVLGQPSPLQMAHALDGRVPVLPAWVNLPQGGGLPGGGLAGSNNPFAASLLEDLTQKRTGSTYVGGRSVGGGSTQTQTQTQTSGGNLSENNQQPRKRFWA